MCNNMRALSSQLVMHQWNSNEILYYEVLRLLTTSEKIRFHGKLLVCSGAEQSVFLKLCINMMRLHLNKFFVYNRLCIIKI